MLIDTDLLRAYGEFRSPGLRTSVEFCKEYQQDSYCNRFRGSFSRSVDDPVRDREQQTLISYLERPDIWKQLLLSEAGCAGKGVGGASVVHSSYATSPWTRGNQFQEQARYGTTARMRLPVYHLVSPRTRQRIALIPAPTTERLAAAEALEAETKQDCLKVTSRLGLYRELHRYGLLTNSAPSEKDTGQDELHILALIVSEEALLHTTYEHENAKLLRYEVAHSAPLSQEFSSERTLNLSSKKRSHHAGPLKQASLECIELRKKYKSSHEMEEKERQFILLQMKRFYREHQIGCIYTAVQLGKLVSYLLVLQLHTSGSTALAAWKAFTMQAIIARRDAAAEIIQARVRQHLAWRGNSITTALIEKDQNRRRQKLHQFVLERQIAAIIIQGAWRGWVAKQLTLRTRRDVTAAKMLQCNWRIIFEFRRSRYCVTESLRRLRAVMKIQTCWRGHMARAKLRLLKNIRSFIHHKASAARRGHIVREQLYLLGAIVGIQQFWRHILASRRQGSLLRLIQRSQAVKIQRAYRRCIVRRNVLAMRLAYVKHREKRKTAVVKMQTQARKYFARCQYVRRREEKQKAQLIRRIAKDHAFARRHIQLAGVIVDKWKQWERLYRVLALLDPFNHQRAVAAAIKIQRVARGYRARQKSKKAREQDYIQRLLIHHYRRRKAATDIQRILRGTRGRRIAQYTRQQPQLIRIQCHWRSYRVRKVFSHLQHLHQAAVILQRYMRGFLCIRRYHSGLRQHIVQAQGAKTIQRLFRHTLSRLRAHADLDLSRWRYEIRTVAQLYIDLQAQIVQRRLLLDSLHGPFDYKCTYTSRAKRVSGKPTRVTHQFPGEVQALFQHFSQVPNQDRLENTGFIQLLRHAPGVLGSQINDTDIDLLFAKLKVVNTKYIVWSSFLMALDAIALVLYGETLVYQGLSGRDARVMTLVCECILKSPWAEPYVQALKEHALYLTGGRVTRIQALHRGRQGRIIYRKQKADSQLKRKQMRLGRAATKIQCLWRRAQARILVVHTAQQVYVKYIDATTGLPYWHQTRSGRTTWAKPRLFGIYDVAEIRRVPEKAIEYVVNCVACENKLASLVCDECGEVFCENCFGRLHLKGRRKQHTGRPVKMCMQCGYQTATQICQTCTLRQGPSQVYCDACFWTLHSEDQWINSKGHNMVSKGKGMAGHKALGIVVLCVECERLAARWRCEDCRDCFCTKCFSALHARGRRLQHRYDALRYYTRAMHQTYEMQVLSDNRRTEMAENLHLLERLRNEQRQRRAVLLQKMWRGVQGRRTGRRYLKNARGALRTAYRKRKADAVIRGQLLYKVKEHLALAPRLPSDNMQERVLKHFPKLIQPIVVDRIKGNVEYEPAIEKDGKRRPKRGFDVGSEAELVEQGLFGGSRLPGYVSVQEGERLVSTTVDLRSIIGDKARIRIKHYWFSLDERRAVKADKVYLARLWRNDSVDRIVMYKVRHLTALEASLATRYWELLGEGRVQSIIRRAVKVMEQMARLLGNAITWAKDKGYLWLVEALMKIGNWLAKRQRRTRYLLRDWQEKTTLDGRDGPTVDEDMALEQLAKLRMVQTRALKRTEAKYLSDSSPEWEEDGRDERTGKRRWTNTVTGEVTDVNPLLTGTAEGLMSLTVAQGRATMARTKRMTRKQRGAVLLA